MARLLLFAAVREAAGCRTAEVAASSVGEALAVATERFGPGFERLVRCCTLLVDDEPLPRGAVWSVTVDDTTEIALLPPVSGGEGPLSALGSSDRAVGDGDHHHASTLKLRFAVLTVSDRSAGGSRPDGSGPRVEQMVTAGGGAVVARGVVPDDRDRIEAELRAWADGGTVDVVLTTGGTGLAPRDVTPEATRAVIDREVPGLAEAMRAAGCRSTPFAALSRQVTGFRGCTVIVNLPGSPAAATEGLQVVMPVLAHAVALARAPVTGVAPRARPLPVVVTGLSESPLDVAALVAPIRSLECGAVVAFEGTTRATTAGRSVLRLEYEAHDERARAQLKALAEEVAARHSLVGVVAVHRTGAVPPGQPAVGVAAAAPHRAEAFAAAASLIDRLKAEVAIWKKEVWAGGGSNWVGLADEPAAAHGDRAGQIEA